ncbi:MAG: hypothetical protein V1743_07220 [Nanoarchaeota archaeon]
MKRNWKWHDKSKSPFNMEHESIEELRMEFLEEGDMDVLQEIRTPRQVSIAEDYDENALNF